MKYYLYLCRPNYVFNDLGKIDKYKVDLKNMPTDVCVYEYQLDDEFFSDLEASEIQKGILNATLNVRRTSGIYQLDFHIEGTVVVTCDLCLEDMEQSVDCDDTLRVKFGEDFSDTDDLVVVPEEDGYIDVAWFMYEFIVLSLPMKHVHAPGECNMDMVHKLKKHLRGTIEDEESDFSVEMDTEDAEPKEIDPRWSELKKILDNN